MILNIMINNQLSRLTLFELKKNLLHSKDWLSNFLFLLVNMAIVPFTINPTTETLHQFFLSVIMTSMLLGIVLITNHIFDEDSTDGSLDQYQIFGLPIYIIYLSKVISVSCEFALIMSFAFIGAALFYAIEMELIWKIWLVVILAIPLFASISVFGAMLTINLRKTSAIAILLIFPLLISALILLSLAIDKILVVNSLQAAFSYVEMNLGFTLLLTPLLCVLVKYLQ